MRIFLGNMARAGKRLFWAAMDLYALGMLAYLVLRVLVGERFWPVILMNTFAHVLLLPALGLLPLAVWRRASRVLPAVALGACVLAFVGWFGPLFVPSAAAAARPTLVVMSANVGLAYDDGAPARLVAMLLDADADVVVLQELSVPQQEAIERELPDLYPYRALYGAPLPHVTGKGLLSRYPIMETEVFRLHEKTNLHMRAVIDIDGTHVTVVNAHPPAPGFQQRVFMTSPVASEEIAALSRMAAAEGPGFLVGDFNLTDQTENYAIAAEAGLIDAFREAGWGFGTTWPAALPLVRIDYVWHTPHFQAVDAWTGQGIGGDHLPVLAALALSVGG